MQIKAENHVQNDDCYHLGNFFMDYMIQNPEDHMWQIDAATGQTESKLSVKSRSIRLARSLRNAGLVPGDVLVVSGKNHLDVHIPFYAAFLNGLPLAGVDPLYRYEEIKFLFTTTNPKIAFCELENYDNYSKAAKDLGLDIEIVTFGVGDHSMAELLKKYDDNTPEEEFKVARFDTDIVFAWLISTSGTTGLPKVAAFKHQDIIRVLCLYRLLKEKEIKPALNLSSVQWISSYLASLSMITANHIKVQSSAPITIEHAIDIINKYKPVVSTGSPNLFAGLIRHPKHCDLTSFNKIVITGSSINEQTLRLIKSRMRDDAVIWNLFAQTECIGAILMPSPSGPAGNVGKDLEIVKTQLVDPKTGEVITEPNKIGELWSKGPRFVEYYNNPEATVKAFTADGWYKTGDLLYRDDNGYYFFVDRMSSVFKCRRYFVMPMELEQLIRTHKDVIDVCVIGHPHPEDGKRAVACVVKRTGSSVTEQDIKDLVAERMSIHKHLHGGVIFVDDLPKTPSGKIARAKIDAATGETESKLSVKSRSIRLARSLRNAGLVPGDVLVVSGRNHLDVHIPFYAAYLNGLPLAGVEPLYTYEEIKLLFTTTKPKMAFCEPENYDDYSKAAKELGLDIEIVTFGVGDNSMAELLKKYDDNTPEAEFKVATFDTDKVYAWLISTSGTTGLPKVAALKHQDIIKVLSSYGLMKKKEIKPALNLSSVQWISSYWASLSMITSNQIKVQSSAPFTIEHVIDVINKYKPVVSTGNPNLFAGIVRDPKHCDLTCFNTIVITGSPVNEQILRLIKSRMRDDAVIWNLFGQTECIGAILMPSSSGPAGNVGKDIEIVKTQLVDPKTGEVITEPNKIGELWSKGPSFVEYYNNPEATAKAFTADGWYKTGDLLYRDENGYYFFVARMSSDFNRDYFLMSMELDQLIRTHKDVVDVCVIGLPQPEVGKRAVACVVRRPASSVTEQDINDLVAEKMSIYKHLHGGVIFVDDFPKTPSGKIAHAKLCEFVKSCNPSYL